MESASPSKRILPPLASVAGVTLLALGVRLLVLSQASHDPQFNSLGGDGTAYWEWAQRIAAGDWIGHDVFYQTPLYPYVIAILRSVAKVDLQQIRFLQACFGAFGCGVGFLLGLELFDEWTGWILGLMLALYPAAISFDLQIDKAVLDIPLATTFLWMIVTASKRRVIWRWIVAGALAGLLALNRENALVLVIITVAWILFQLRDVPIKQRWMCVGALAAGAAIILLPVAIRNKVAGGSFELTTAQFGPNFYIGNGANADGAYRPLRPDRGDPKYERIDATELAEQAAGTKLSAAQVSSYWTNRALQDMTNAPMHWLGLFATKAVMVFAHSELADSDVHDRLVVYSPVLKLLDAVWGFGVIFALAAAGLMLTVRTNSLVRLLAALVVAYALSVALFYIFSRYRLAMIPMLVALAAIGVRQIALASRDRRIYWPAGVAIILAGLFVWLAEGTIPNRLQGANDYNRAMALAQKKEIVAAVTSYESAIAKNPNLLLAYNNLALLLVSNRQIPAAMKQLDRAIVIDPNDLPTHINRGLVFGVSNDWPAAEAEFRRALAIDPASTAAKYNLGAALMQTGRAEQGKALLREIASPDSDDPFRRRAASLLNRGAIE